MNDFGLALATALELLLSLDPALVEIILLSLRVTLSAVALAAAIGIPLGALLAIGRFPGRAFAALLVDTFMGLPPVVVGLVVYLWLSRSGPLGVLGLLYTPTAMILAQCLLVTPIVAALTRQVVADIHGRHDEQLRSLGANRRQRAATLLWESRFSLLTAVLAGFGRANAEVGAVMIVGGNINHVTRVMTTSIAYETSRGNLTTALALGFVLLLLAMLLTLLLRQLRKLRAGPAS